MKKRLNGIALFMSLFSALVAAADKDLDIDSATIRSPIPGVTNTAGYVQLVNNSERDIVLTDAASDIANKVEYHNHIMKAGVMKMVKLDKVVIPAGQTVTFESGGLHLMFLGLKSRQLPDKVTVTLTAKDGADFAAEFTVKSIKEQHQHHHH